MATLVLGALGTLVGGPIGGAIGATLGRSVDQLVIGAGKREGPRLKELSVSTSSYGQPIPALYGTVRVPGTVIWSTDLEEHRETSGGGKRKPKTTSYSYSVSLAVALSSRPIERIGRIWADGNLLRGAGGDLKTGGTLRTYTGHGDQSPDPLMAAALGSECPAHRGCAYVVFEDLALEDFGNRIPALSFEVVAGNASHMVDAIAADEQVEARQADFAELEGFVHEAGDIASVLSLVSRLNPLGAVATGGALSLEGIASPEGDIPVLPPPSAWDEGDFGRESGAALARKSMREKALSALRYYDPARDFQPGLQRIEGDKEAGANPVLEFPGVFAAPAARSLLARASRRDEQRGEALSWRMSQLDPALGPGAIVRAPDMPGLWRITGWEWREAGVELELVRHVPQSASTHTADAGSGWLPPDREAVGSSLRVIELPWDGVGSSGTVQRFAAVGAATGRWPGASLYAVEGDALAPIGATDGARAVSGILAEPLGPSSGLRLEAAATLVLALDNHDAQLEPATTGALARGANRLLVGNEIIQFAEAQPQGDGTWLLTGLLRARGGTENAAMAGHAAGTAATLLDDRLLEVPASATGTEFAAIGIEDEEPVVAPLEGAGVTRRPLLPVHPRAQLLDDGRLKLSWTRRARGGWAWLDEVEQPLVEQSEAYEVGIGSPDAPDASWQVAQPEITLDLAQVGAHAGATVWVRQRGSYAMSPPLLLTTLPTSN